MTSDEEILTIAENIGGVMWDRVPDEEIITFARRIQAAQKEKDAGICEEDVIRRHLQYLDKRTWQECAAAIREQT